MLAIGLGKPYHIRLASLRENSVNATPYDALASFVIRPSEAMVLILRYRYALVFQEVGVQVPILFQCG